MRVAAHQYIVFTSYLIILQLMFRSTVQITKYIRNKFAINWIHNLKALWH